MEIHALLSAPTAMEQAIATRFQSASSAVETFCEHRTRDDCCKASRTQSACGRLHFRKLNYNQTDSTAGDCPFLNGCFNMHRCRYQHWEVDRDPQSSAAEGEKSTDESGQRDKSVEVGWMMSNRQPSGTNPSPSLPTS